MGFSSDNIKHINVVVPDPGATKKIHLFRADQKVTLKRITSTSVTTGTANTYQYENHSTAGTAIKAGATGTVAASVSGTALVASVPLTATLVSGSETLASGEWLVLNHTKSAGDTFVEKLVSIHIEYVDGAGV